MPDANMRDERRGDGGRPVPADGRCAREREDATMIRVRDSLISLCGVVAGQVALFGCISLIGRFQGPEALGHFNYLLALATFAGTLLACRYELACVSDNPADSFNAFVNVMVLAGAAVSIGCVAIAVAGRTDLYIVAAYGFAAFAQLAAGGYLNSLRRYGWIAASRIAVNGSFLVGVLAATFAPTFRARSGSIDAFRAYAAITAAVALLMLIAVALHGRRRGYSFAVTRAFFVEHNRFAKYILPSTLCGSVLTYALAIVIPHWFDAQSAGYFAAAYRLGFFPVSLIAQSLGGVFRRDAMAAMAGDDAHMLVPKVFGAYARARAARGRLRAGRRAAVRPACRAFLRRALERRDRVLSLHDSAFRIPDDLRAAVADLSRGARAAHRFPVSARLRCRARRRARHGEARGAAGAGERAPLFVLGRRADDRRHRADIQRDERQRVASARRRLTFIPFLH